MEYESNRSRTCYRRADRFRIGLTNRRHYSQGAITKARIGPGENRTPVCWLRTSRSTVELRAQKVSPCRELNPGRSRERGGCCQLHHIDSCAVSWTRTSTSGVSSQCSPFELSRQMSSQAESNRQLEDQNLLCYRYTMRTGINDGSRTRLAVALHPEWSPRPLGHR